MKKNAKNLVKKLLDNWKFVSVIAACALVLVGAVAFGVHHEKAIAAEETTAAIEVVEKTEDTEDTDTKVYEEKAEKAKGVLKAINIYEAPKSYGTRVYFDTYSGVMYYKLTSATNGASGYITLYSADGNSVRNIYEEEGVYSTEERVKFILDNYWDEL